MGLIAASLFLHGASVLVAPWWTPRPRRLPLVAAVSVVVWVLVLLAGAVLGGW